MHQSRGVQRCLYILRAIPNTLEKASKKDVTTASLFCVSAHFLEKAVTFLCVLSNQSPFDGTWGVNIRSIDDLSGISVTTKNQKARVQKVLVELSILNRRRIARYFLQSKLITTTDFTKPVGNMIIGLSEHYVGHSEKIFSIGTINTQGK